ncbi:MAG: S8 family serine peptidase [Parvibaculum sp.]|uniref:S8 family peptidase n=1 Tax=Parvibaculum sp. TaxID=2024848 RepID=UPI0025D291FA|nr:S8 family peptidase [Parvibaculum sp.]MCE9650929.1 S8 family serine peptidase [Parvibaculum sp.]
MRKMFRKAGRAFRKTGVIAIALSLASCGGGGGGGGGGTPQLSPAPPPPPGNIPAPLTLLPQTNILSTEYYNSTYLSQINAYGAYLLGATGSGVNVAVIDGGIVDTNHELQGQVLRHIDVTGSNPSGGSPDHGTAVGSIIAAKRDNSGVEGVAYNAHLYDFNVFQPGTSGPTALDSNVARALEIIAGNNSSYTGIDARIVNMSLGGTTSFSSAVISGFAHVASADKVMVISAGNDGAANPSPSARAAANAALNGQMIIVGAVDSSDVIAGFSNRAGSYKDYFVVAPGVSEPAVSTSGGYVYFTGTSAAAPVVSGTLAVLAEAYPYLSAADLVRLVEQTAVDLGAAGVDAVYGWGRVDLTRAMNPVAPLFVALGSTVNGALVPAGTSSFLTGNAFGAPKGGETALIDAFGRAYTVPLSALGGTAGHHGLLGLTPDLDGAATTPGLGDFLAHWRPQAGAALSFSSGSAMPGTSDGVVMAFSRNTFGAVFRNARPAALTAVEGLEPSTAAGRSLFLVTDNAVMPQGEFMERNFAGSAYGFRTDDYAAAIGFGTAHMPDGASSRLVQASLALPAAPFRAGVTAGLLDEDGSLLGSYGTGAFHQVGGRTFFTTVSAGASAGRWALDLAYTRASLEKGALGQGLEIGKAEADAVALTLTGPVDLRDGDGFGIRLAQPLRATSARLDAFLPVARTYEGDIVRERQMVDLAPTGREVDLEAAYTTPLPELGVGRLTVLRLNAFIVRQPGNDETASTGAGLAAQLTVSW